MKTSIATVSISGDLREKLAAIAAAGTEEKARPFWAMKSVT